MNRLLLAFILGPISFGALLFILSLFMGSSAEGAWIMKFAALVGYPLAIVLGVPFYFLLKKYTESKYGHYVLASLIFAILLIGYFILWPFLSSDLPNRGSLLSASRIYQMLFLVIASVFSVSVFWMIARPDKTVAN